METVLASIKSVSQTLYGQLREDGTRNERKIVTFLIGSEEFPVSVFRGLNRFDQQHVGEVGMLTYKTTGTISYSKTTGDPYVQHSVQVIRWEPKVSATPEPAEPQAPGVGGMPEASAQQVAAGMAEAAAEVAINPENGLPF